MSLSEETTTKLVERLAPILRYIEQESDEKVDEIHVRGDEDAKLEIKKVVQHQCEQVERFYAKKFRQLDVKHKVHISNKTNNARIECLKERERLTQEILSETRQDLSKISADKNRYPHILKGLILQGLLQLLEKRVILKCRMVDKPLIENMLDDILNEQEKICEFKTDVIINTEKYNVDKRKIEILKNHS